MIIILIDCFKRLYLIAFFWRALVIKVSGSFMWHFMHTIRTEAAFFIVWNVDKDAGDTDKV